MKVLIIPDVHNRVEWAERVIRGYPEHRVVFLGDYFDSYGDTPSTAVDTATWLRWSIGKGRIHLMGNHDIPYRWPNQGCPGYTKEKGNAVRVIMTREHWSEVRLAFRVDATVPRPLVLSHAGFTLANLYGAEDYRDVAPGGRLSHLRDLSAADHLQELRVQLKLCQIAGDNALPHHWLNQGTRMGARNVGGPFWLDRHELHSPLPGIDQVIGHSHVHEPQRHCVPHAAAPICTQWFIDGAGKFAALYEDGKITPIWATPDERFGTPAYTPPPP